jgi:uncharacterized protein YndB with AHSA1/START domain
MPHIRGTIEIARPVETVFDVVADQTQEPTYNPQMIRSEKATPGPIGAGTRFRAAARSGTHEVPISVELVDYVRPRHLGVLTAAEGTFVDGTIDFDPCPGGTRMSWEWDVHPPQGVRFLGPLFGWLGRRQEQRVWRGLKDYLEDRQQPRAVRDSVRE